MQSMLRILMILILGFPVAANAAPWGEALAERWCADCHAIRPGQESQNPKAPTFPAIAAERTATDYALRVFLRSTHATMPNLKLTPEEIEDLVAYIRSLSPKR